MTALEKCWSGSMSSPRAPFWQRLVFAPAERREAAAARADAEALLAQVAWPIVAICRPARWPMASSGGWRSPARSARGRRCCCWTSRRPGMNSVEIEQLAGIIRSLTAAGRTVLLVEHNMALVMGICDRLTVLNFGRLLAEGTPDAIARDPAVVAAYLGADDAGMRAGTDDAIGLAMLTWRPARRLRAASKRCADLLRGAGRARSSAWSAPTARARARRWRRSPAWCARAPARILFEGRT